jgi:hypothetical protein
MTRTEAAATTINRHLVLSTLPANYVGRQEDHQSAADANSETLARKALEASDAVLFSAEAITRAAEALRRQMGGHPDENWTEEVQLVINALKGES